MISLLRDELQDGLFGFVIMPRIRGEDEFPAAGAFADVHFLVGSFPRLFEFIGQLPVLAGGVQVFVPFDRRYGILVLFS